MNAVPRRWWSDGDNLFDPLPVQDRLGEIKTLGANADGVVIECEIVNPPSSAGRTVYVHFNADAVTKMIVEFRRSAIAARSGTLAEVHP